MDEDRGLDSDSDFTIRGRLLSLVEKVSYLKKKMVNLPNEKKDRKPSEFLHRPPPSGPPPSGPLSLKPVFCLPAGTLQQLISDTMVRWAQESVIEDPELVRAMFVLLHRQYDGIGGLVRGFKKICQKRLYEDGP